jgi:hypothetical protein
VTTATLEDVASPPKDRWLLEFMVVGGVTLLLFPLSWILRRVVSFDSADYAFGFVTFYGAYVINDPHFSVTYLLFYKDLRKRIRSVRYVIAGFVVPIAMAAWAIAAIAMKSAQMIGWMVQLMYLLVGWHYVKQGFGVLVVLSARRGKPPSARVRMAVLFHCFAGWAFAWANPSVPSREYEEKGVIYTALAHPRWLELATGAVLALSVLVLVPILVLEWNKVAKAPLLGLLITVWSWSIFSSIDPLVQYTIPALHSIQYFYFVYLMKRNEARAHEGPPDFGRPARVKLGILAISALGLGWLLFRGAPTFFDDALIPRSSRFTDLGPTPYFAAFFVFVNIHHYFMDNVIWRRDNPDTRWLRN